MGRVKGSTYPKGQYFHSPQSSTVIKSNMVATTIRTRTRFRPPKIRCTAGYIQCYLFSHLIVSHSPCLCLLGKIIPHPIRFTSLHLIFYHFIPSHCVSSYPIQTLQITSHQAQCSSSPCSIVPTSDITQKTKIQEG